MSWAMPSVTMIAPPTRSGGVSRSASRKRAEQLHAVIVGIVARRLDDMRLDIAERGELLFDRRARRVRLRGALAEPVRLRAVDDERDDVLQRLAVLALQGRVGERDEEQRRGQRAQPRRRAGGARRSGRRR